MTVPASADQGTSGGLVFVDSNVLLYAFDEADYEKQAAAQSWRKHLWITRRGRVSVQVLNEFYVNATRMKPSGKELARAETRDLLAWNPVVINAMLLEGGWRLQDRYRLSYWDALIVAAAIVSNCAYLLTEDFQSGQVMAGVEVVNPFRRSPESLQ